MRLWASAADQKTLPNSLRERLALLEREGPWQDSRRAVKRLVVTSVRRLRLGSSFALGLGISCIAGGLALLSLVFLQSRPIEPMRPEAIAALLAESPAASAPAVRASAPDTAEGQPPVFELTIRRSERGDAPFPIRLVGADDADNISIVLRGLPATTGLSRGKPRGPHTWVLRPADLEALQITLGKNTPDTFDVTIEATSRSGAPLARSIARVRIADTRATLPFRTTVRETPFRTEVAPAAPGASGSPASRPVPAIAAAPPIDAPANPLSPRRPPLEGQSALGGPVPGSMTSSQSLPGWGRAVWWKVPATAWAPFDAQQQ